MVHVRSELARGGAAARRLRQRAGRFLAELGRGRDELSVLLVGDGAMRALNRAWRGVDRPTDVLSFSAAPGSQAALLGDLVISLDTARRQARSAGRPMSAELDRYLAHGLLHLVGHDHQRPGEARAMAALEERLLEGRGMVGASLGPGPRSRARARGEGRPGRGGRRSSRSRPA